MPTPESLMPQSNERVQARHAPGHAERDPGLQAGAAQVPRLSQVTDQPQPDARSQGFRAGC